MGKDLCRQEQSHIYLQNRSFESSTFIFEAGTCNWWNYSCCLSNNLTLILFSEWFHYCSGCCFWVGFFCLMGYSSEQTPVKKRFHSAIWMHGFALFIKSKQCTLNSSNQTFCRGKVCLHTEHTKPTLYASSIFAFMQCCIISFTSRGWGSSHTCIKQILHFKILEHPIIELPSVLTKLLYGSNIESECLTIQINYILSRMTLLIT